MNENPEHIPSKDEMKEALLILLEIDEKFWTPAHDDILEDYQKVRELIKREELKDGETIKNTKNGFKSLYNYFSRDYRDFKNIKNKQIIGYAIKIIAETIVTKAEIDTIYKEARYDLQKKPKYSNIDELKNNIHNSYMVTIAIIFDIYSNGSNHF